MNVLESKRNSLPLDGGRCEKIEKWKICPLISLVNFPKKCPFHQFFHTFGESQGGGGNFFRIFPFVKGEVGGSFKEMPGIQRQLSFPFTMMSYPRSSASHGIPHFIARSRPRVFLLPPILRWRSPPPSSCMRPGHQKAPAHPHRCWRPGCRSLPGRGGE